VRDAQNCVSQDLEYTARDHVFRVRDPYAWAKYRITTRWLKPWVAPGMTLFNVGCGSGEYNEVAAEMGLRVIACEPDATAFEMARGRALAFRDGACEVRRCGLFELGVHGERADFIVAHDVLEHIEDDRAAADHLASLLCPHGRLVLSVPSVPWLFGQHDVRLGHFRRYSATSLRAVVEPRFRVARIRYFGMTGIPIALWFSVIRRSPYPTGDQPSWGARILARAFGGACRAEERLPLPLGTSILTELIPR
jgi:2-polyprenyl-3-methyl-5-hydroxy-6-metoxy-1,4-benzoquinol methylase